MPVDYGRDTSCMGSLRTGRFVTGARLVAESVYRRLTTPRGMLRGGEAELIFGIDLTDLIGDTNPRVVAATLPGRVRSEIEKDERILSVDVTVLETTSGGLTSFTVTVDAVTGAGPFSLQLLASAVSVELLGIAA